MDYFPAATNCRLSRILILKWSQRSSQLWWSKGWIGRKQPCWKRCSWWIFLFACSCKMTTYMNKDISEKRNQESAVISQAWSELLESVWFVVCELFSKKCLTVVLTVIISLNTRQSTSELSKGYIKDGLFNGNAELRCSHCFFRPNL